MGKEFRVGLSVVGALLLGFCVLLYARFFRGSSGAPDTSIELQADPVAATPAERHVRRTPTIVKGGISDFSASNPADDLANPRPAQQEEPETFDDVDDRQRLFLPIAPAPLSEDFVSTGRGPDAVAPSPTLPVRVQPGEDLQQLAARIYAGTGYERALWQWLFDRDLVDSIQPGATIELPTRATLIRSYPQLLRTE